VLAVHVGKSEIEDHQVGPGAGDHVKRGTASTGFDDSETVAPQIVTDELAQLRLVVDHQDRARTAQFLTSIVSEPPRNASRGATRDETLIYYPL